PAARGAVMAAHFVRGLGERIRDADALALVVNGDKDEIGAGYVDDGAGAGVLSPHLDSHLHGRRKSTIDAGAQRKQVAEMDGADEVDVVHGRSDDVGARVAVGSHGSGQVNEVHEAAAEQV